MKYIFCIILATILLSLVTCNLKRKRSSKKKIVVVSASQCIFDKLRYKCRSYYDCHTYKNALSCSVLPGCEWTSLEGLVHLTSGICQDNDQCAKYPIEDCMSTEEKAQQEAKSNILKNKEMEELKANEAREFKHDKARHKKIFGDKCHANSGPKGCEKDEFCTKDHLFEDYHVKNLVYGHCQKKITHQYYKCLKNYNLDNDEYDVQCHEMYCVKFKACVPENTPSDWEHSSN